METLDQIALRIAAKMKSEGWDIGLSAASVLANRLVDELEKQKPVVWCAPTEHEGRIVYEHSSEPIPNADTFPLFAAPVPESKGRE